MVRVREHGTHVLGSYMHALRAQKEELGVVMATGCVPHAVMRNILCVIVTLSVTKFDLNLVRCPKIQLSVSTVRHPCALDIRSWSACKAEHRLMLICACGEGVVVTTQCKSKITSFKLCNNFSAMTGQSQEHSSFTWTHRVSLRFTNKRTKIKSKR